MNYCAEWAVHDAHMHTLNTAKIYRSTTCQDAPGNVHTQIAVGSENHLRIPYFFAEETNWHGWKHGSAGNSVFIEVTRPGGR